MHQYMQNHFKEESEMQHRFRTVGEITITNVLYATEDSTGSTVNLKGDEIMKINKINSSLTDDGRETERIGEMKLLIVAIDPESLMKIKSATFHFPNKEKGLEVFDDLVTTAGSASTTYI